MKMNKIYLKTRFQVHTPGIGLILPRYSYIGVSGTNLEMSGFKLGTSEIDLEYFAKKLGSSGGLYLRTSPGADVKLDPAEARVICELTEKMTNQVIAEVELNLI